MSRPVLLQPSYVLHTRYYRETSSLITLFTQDYGRVDAIARGVRCLRSPLKGLLQPFQALQVSWAGRGELVTIKDAELSASPMNLQQETMMMGLYINEILMRVLATFDAHAALFTAYQSLLRDLHSQQPKEIVLRTFERLLLAELGFGINLFHDATGKEIDAQTYYDYQPEQGFLRSSTQAAAQTNHFIGKHLLAIAQDCYEENVILQDCKRLMRLAMNHLLQYRPIRSRELYYSPRSAEGMMPALWPRLQEHE